MNKCEFPWNVWFSKSEHFSTWNLWYNKRHQTQKDTHTHTQELEREYIIQTQRD